MHKFKNSYGGTPESQTTHYYRQDAPWRSVHGPCMLSLNKKYLRACRSRLEVLALYLKN
jgi:hypothetical protein